MTRQLVWDPAPGETRCVLVEQGVPVELHLLRTATASPTAAAGSRHTARLVSRLGNGRALIALESGEEALLQPVPPVAEGAAIAVEITRPRLPEPGRWKRALARPADPDAEPPLAAQTLLFDRASELICADIRAAPLPGPGVPPVRIDAEAVAALEIETLVDQARSGLWAFEGGLLSIERTRAMTVIDIDGTLAPLALNLAAAQAIGHVLRLFAITGPVGIDFVGMSSRADRQAVDHALAEACAALGPHERTAINGFGFCQLVRPRKGPSVAEHLCGTTPGRLSVESQALLLLREAARSQGVGVRTITALPGVVDVLRQWPRLLDQVRRMSGADVKLVCEPGVSGYGHVHVAPA